MSVIDFPAFNKDVPRLGTCVVVALDPAASLAVLDDHIVEAAAERVKTHRRLVVVDFVLGGHGGAYYRYHPIGSGVPHDPAECVPIHPASAHPEDRAPICFSKPLPVDDGYVHTAETFEGGVSRIYMGQPSDIQCSTEDRRRLSRQYTDYLMRRSVVSLHPVHEPEHGADDESVATETQYFTVSNPWGECVQTFAQPMYRMWLDVDEKESYADPSTLQDEIAELSAIEKEWRERREAEVKAKIDQLQAWREGVDVPRGTEEQDGCDPGDHPADDDASILPQHAVGEDLAGEVEGATSGPIEPFEPKIALTDDIPLPESVFPCNECQSKCAVPMQRIESTPPVERSVISTKTPSTKSSSSGSVLGGWVTSARAWVKEVAFSNLKVTFVRGLSALVPGEHW